MDTRNVARSLLVVAVAALAGATLAAGCGGSDTSTALPPGYYITISGMAFSPLNLAAPPGATVTVINRDAMLHSVTEEATSGAFTPGAPTGVTPFDTGLFQGTKTFVLPATIAEGTVLHYYCTSHTSLMTTPNGTITITAAAQPGTGGGGGGGGAY